MVEGTEKGKEEEAPKRKAGGVKVVGPGRKEREATAASAASLQEAQLKRWQELAGILHS